MFRHCLLLIFFPFLLFLASCSDDGSSVGLLAEAESVMEQYPDSALAIVQSIPSAHLRSERVRALHSLLLTQASYKCYIPIENDSLIASAVAYFDDSSDRFHRMLARYYLGVVRLELKEYSGAITSLFSAYDLARELDDKFWIGMAAMSINMLYHDNYCVVEELKFAKIELENFEIAGKTNFRNHALHDVADGYHSNCEYDLAIELTTQLLDTAAKYSDKILEYNSLRLLVLSSLGKRNFKETLEYSKRICESDDANATDSAYLAVMYLRTGDRDRAEIIMSRLSNSTSLPSDQAHWMKYEFYSHLDSIPKALEMMSGMNSDTDNILRRLRKENLSGALIEHENYKTALAKAELRASRAVAWSIALGAVMVILLIVYVALRHHRLQREAIMRYVDMTQNLRSVIEESERRRREELEEMRSREESEKMSIDEDDASETKTDIPGLEMHFIELDALCRGFYENSDSIARKNFAAGIDKFIDTYTKDESSIMELERYVDSRYDNLMSDLRVDFPKINRTDRLFILYSRLGFSNMSIALFLREDKITAIYDRRKRLKKKFRESAGGNSGKYLDALG